MFLAVDSSGSMCERRGVGWDVVLYVAAGCDVEGGVPSSLQVRKGAFLSVARAGVATADVRDDADINMTPSPV